MSDRITTGDLKDMVAYINERTGQPMTLYTMDKSGNDRANIGHYFISSAYGGYTLCQITSKGGSRRDISMRMSKSALYEWLNAFIKGIESTKKRK